MAEGLRFEFFPFYGHTPRADGVASSACLSQWYAARFVVDGTRYETAEHFMMAEKARLFGDDEARARMLIESSPAKVKALGRQVRGFDAARWAEHRFEIVVRGNVAKFSAAPALRAFLLATGDAVLVEASPRDRVWGIGLGRTSPADERPEAWRGENLLGFALMQARQTLRSLG